MRESNDRIIYDWFNNLLSVDCGSPALNFPHFAIDDSPHPNKRSRYTSDHLPDAISVTYGYYVSTLTTPSNSPKLLEPNYDDPDTLHTIMSGNPYHGRIKRGYWSRFHYGIIYYKNWCSNYQRVPLTTVFINVTDLS